MQEVAHVSEEKRRSFKRKLSALQQEAAGLIEQTQNKLAKKAKGPRKMGAGLQQTLASMLRV